MMSSDAEEDAEEGSESDEEEEEEELLEQLADIPFEMLEKIRRDGHVSAPPRAASGNRGGPAGSTKARSTAEAGGSKPGEEEARRSFKRANKNAPVEMSSKRPVGRFRDVVQSSKRRVGWFHRPVPCDAMPPG